jgi:hypothetical protein
LFYPSNTSQKKCGETSLLDQGGDLRYEKRCYGVDADSTAIWDEALPLRSQKS